MPAQFSFTSFPPLETARLSLERISKEYAQDLFLLRNNEEVMRYIGRPRPESVDAILAWIDDVDNRFETLESLAWMVIDKSDRKLVGLVGFWRMQKEHFRAEVGYQMFPQYWGKGLMSEALRAAVGFAFDHMQMHSIEADIDVRNAASAHILERNGFVREALFKENFYWEGEFLDSAIYSVLRKDWRFT